MRTPFRFIQLYQFGHGQNAIRITFPGIKHFFQHQPLRRRGNAQIHPAAALQHGGNDILRQLMQPHIDQRARNNAYHVIQKGIAPNAERDHIALLLQLHIGNGAHRGPGAAAGGGKGLKVVCADQVLCCARHGLCIKSHGHMVGKALQQGRALTGIIDAVAVLLALCMKAGMKAGLHLFGTKHAYIPGQIAVQHIGQPLCGNGGLDIQMRALAHGMHAGIRSAGARNADALPGAGQNGLLQLLLYRGAVLLALPAGIIGALIGDGE